MTNRLSALFGCSGPALSSWERAFFGEVRPWGYILFGRNIETPDQVKKLTDELRAASDDPEAPVFIDQEGGTVARLKAPNFRHPPAAHRFGDLFSADPETAAEAAWLNARIMAHDLKEMGINANFAPVLDIVKKDAHPFLQSRSFGDTAEAVSTLGKATALGLRDGGVAPVIKHAPGHGKGDGDSHLTLPRVDLLEHDLEMEDFKPFLALRKEAMLLTAHVLYTALDPDHPGTLSRTIVHGLIRDKWGYDGLIITDDINMKALGGSLEERSRAALAAGCEIICHCNGERADMEAVARGAVRLSGDAQRRADRARSVSLAKPKPFDMKEAQDRLERLGLFEAKPA